MWVGRFYTYIISVKLLIRFFRKKFFAVGSIEIFFRVKDAQVLKCK